MSSLESNILHQTKLLREFRSENAQMFNYLNRSGEDRANSIRKILNGRNGDSRSWLDYDSDDEFIPPHIVDQDPTECITIEHLRAFGKECSSDKGNDVGAAVRPCVTRQREPNAPNSHAFGSLLNPPIVSDKIDVEKNEISGFRTAREELFIQNMRKNRGNRQLTDFLISKPPNVSHAERATVNYTSQGVNNSNAVPVYDPTAASTRSLGLRRTVSSKFVPPVRPERPIEVTPSPPSQPQDERLAHLDPRMVELIEHEIVANFEPINWDDIAGLEFAKSMIMETIVRALERPDLYSGVRRPPRGVLLFGPPGTGKTLIGKCIASQSGSTFFSISSSSLTSKYVGEGEKMVRTLFAVAAVHQPAVIFIDEIDALLSKRNENEHESSRRIKNEFFVHIEGATTSKDDRIVIIGATNRPQELDDAARRRFARRLYIPLPDSKSRAFLIRKLLKDIKHNFAEADIAEISTLCNGYSCADLDTLCHEASIKPLRNLTRDEFKSIKKSDLRPVNMEDMRKALRTVRPSVAAADIEQYVVWNNIYGSVADDD